MRKLYFIFTLFFYFSYGGYSQDSIIVEDVKILNNNLIEIINNFIIFESENTNYYTDTIPISINFGYNTSNSNDKHVLFVMQLTPNPPRGTIDNNFYGFCYYKTHPIYFTGNFHNELLELLQNKTIRLKREIYSPVKRELVEDDSGEIYTQWTYLYKNKSFIEYSKICPSCNR